MTDLTRPFVDIVIDLIREKNPSVILLPAHFTLGNPVPATGLADDRNTTIEVISTAASPYTGSQTVNYWRVPLDVIVDTEEKATFELSDRTKLTDLLTEFNQRFGTNLTADDVVEANFPAFDNTPGESHTVTMAAAANSKYIIESVELTVIKSKVPLASVLTVQDLDGLTYEPTP